MDIISSHMVFINPSFINPRQIHVSGCGRTKKREVVYLKKKKKTQRTETEEMENYPLPFPLMAVSDAHMQTALLF